MPNMAMSMPTAFSGVKGFCKMSMDVTITNTRFATLATCARHTHTKDTRIHAETESKADKSLKNKGKSTHMDRLARGAN